MKILELKLKKDVLIVDENNFDYYEIFKDGIYFKLENGDREFVEGNYEFLCKGSELTEEIASELVEDYSDVSDLFSSCLYDFKKRIKRCGFYWLENPISEPEMQGGYTEDGSFIGGYDDNWINEWQEAEEKTFRNHLIFVKTF